MTLEQVINIIQNFAESHLQINSFFEGRLSEENLGKNAQYYRMMIEYTPSQLDQGNETFEFRVGVFGRVNTDMSNRRNVLSDTRQIVTDFIAYFKNNPDNTSLRISLPATITDYFDWSGDGVAGHFFDLVLNQYQGLQFCNLPIRPDVVTNSYLTELGDEFITENGDTLILE